MKPLYMTKIKLVPDSITKEMDAKEFVDLAIKKPYLIRRSRFIAAALGSGRSGRFIVEYDNEQHTSRNSGQPVTAR